MGYLLASAVAALLVTVGAAWLVVQRCPAASFRRQVVLSAASFPLLCLLIFAAIVTFTLATRPAERMAGDGTGMAIFAMVFFLVYALFVGAVVGVPTAIVALRGLRGG